MKKETLCIAAMLPLLAMSANQSNLTSSDSPITKQVIARASSTTVSANYDREDVYVDSSSKLTFSLSNTGASALSGGEFDYTVPSTIEFDGEATNDTCGSSTSTTLSTIVSLVLL